MANRPVIVSACRTPITDAYRGSLAPVGVRDLAAHVVVEAIARAGVAATEVDDVVLGEVLQGGGCIARYAAIAAGLPDDTPGLALNRQCATGLTAVATAAANIAAGMDRVVVAGGAENMTQSPITYAKATYPYGIPEQMISPSHPDRPDAPNLNMMITVGENTAREVGISRERSDEWAYHSHRKAIDAIDAGRFDDEIVPVEVPTFGGEPTVVAVDEHPRRTTTLEKLASLRVLSGIDGGTVTAGNSSPINDGAAALVLMAEEVAEAHGLEPLAYVRSWAAAGVDPARTGLAPTIAIPRALERAGLTLDDVDLHEINEAFASMTVGCIDVLGLDPDTVNVNGGAVALGHPVGASGARLIVTLLHELRRRGGGIGVASLCAGGGMGGAAVIEVPAA
ncbi:MAG: thiolase family protein [Acidimicrobiales bacterium]|nr:thiolase family protein [Acidimicrobiales bacterium]